MSTATMPTDSVASTISWQADQLRSQNYELLGHIWKVVLEVSRGAAVPQHSVAQTVGSSMDWYGMENYQGQNLLPQIAQTRDRSSLIVLDPIIRPDGQVGLPDIPDPHWLPGAPSPEDICWDPSKHRKGAKPPVWKPKQAPMVPQHLYEEDAAHRPMGRARGQMVGTRFLVFGPVVQILVRPVKDNKLLSEGWILTCGGDPATGKMMEMLIHQDTGQAYFYGGKFQISIPG